MFGINMNFINFFDFIFQKLPSSGLSSEHKNITNGKEKMRLESFLTIIF